MSAHTCIVQQHGRLAACTKAGEVRTAGCWGRPEGTLGLLRHHTHPTSNTSQQPNCARNTQSRKARHAAHPKQHTRLLWPHHTDTACLPPAATHTHTQVHVFNLDGPTPASGWVKPSQVLHCPDKAEGEGITGLVSARCASFHRDGGVLVVSTDYAQLHRWGGGLRWQGTSAECASVMCPSSQY
jgi:hypothetical protein